MKRLETKRLILRMWKQSDVNDFYEYAKVKGVGENAGWLSHQSIETSKVILNDFIRNGDVYALEYKINNKVIGSLGIHNISHIDKPIVQKEIGYVLNKEYWGQGLIVEAVNEALKYCFNDLRCDIVWCSHFDFNKQSRRVIVKTGFKLFKKTIQTVISLNKEYPSSLYWLTKEDYWIRKEI